MKKIIETSLMGLSAFGLVLAWFVLVLSTSYLHAAISSALTLFVVMQVYFVGNMMRPQKRKPLKTLILETVQFSFIASLCAFALGILAWYWFGSTTNG